jgi:hypothetical protein
MIALRAYSLLFFTDVFGQTDHGERTLRRELMCGVTRFFTLLTTEGYNAKNRFTRWCEIALYLTNHLHSF